MHEIHHKEHWDKIISIANATNGEYADIKQQLETNLRKYVKEQASLDYRYIYTTVSFNA